MSKDTSIVLKKEVTPIVNKALEVKVRVKGDMLIATDYLSKLNKVADKIEEEKQKVLAPLNLARKAELNRWKPIEEMYEEAIDHLREEIGEFQTAEIKRQKDEEAKIASRIGEGKGKIRLDTAIKKMDEVEKVDTKVSTDSGSVKFREVKVLVVMDKTLVPIDYMIVDERKVLDALKAGIEVSGCKMETKQIPINIR